jgi:hypothetical protein
MKLTRRPDVCDAESAAFLNILCEDYCENTMDDLPIVQAAHQSLSVQGAQSQVAGTHAHQDEKGLVAELAGQAVLKLAV